MLICRFRAARFHLGWVEIGLPGGARRYSGEVMSRVRTLRPPRLRLVVVFALALLVVAGAIRPDQADAAWPRLLVLLGPDGDSPAFLDEDETRMIWEDSEWLAARPDLTPDVVIDAFALWGEPYTDLDRGSLLELLRANPIGGWSGELWVVDSHPHYIETYLPGGVADRRLLGEQASELVASAMQSAPSESRSTARTWIVFSTLGVAAVVAIALLVARNARDAREAR